MNEKKECIIILAGGKASNKPRHLDWLWTKFLRVIDIPIKKSLQVSNNVFICIDESNIALIRYVKKNYKELKVLIPSGPLMMDTFRSAFSFDHCESEKIIIAGDLIDLKKEDLATFCHSNNISILPLLPKPFKKFPYIYSLDKTKKMRTDVGQGIFKATSELQRLFFDENVFNLMKKTRTEFISKKSTNDESANDIWTWMLYLLFDKVYGHDILKKNSIDSGAQNLILIRSDTSNDYDR